MKIAWIFSICVCATATDALAQQPSPLAQLAGQRRSVGAVRLLDGESIVLDGRLDEAAWKRATPAADFIQQDPDNGKPATEPTEVRILFNADTLYMGVVCFDSEADKWLGFQRRRDEFLQADDRFMWNIDTYNNQQSGYFFETNPSGLMGDALRGAGFQNRQWDGIWNLKVRRSELGWTLEVEIPFRTLNFDPAADAWGINFQRTVRRKNEESLWSGWARNQGLNRLSAAGQLTGLTDISQGHGLDVKPYALLTSESFPGRGDSHIRNDANAGLDLFYSPSPRLRTNLTLNTDFAQTEVDQRLVNLTRFPQFFPEKRDFFLDGSTFFDFQSTAQGGNSLLPFFTRRIGLDANGNPQKIDVGGKLAGQFGTNDIGALYVRTGLDRHTDLSGINQTIPGEDFMVLRAKHRMLRQSYVGMLYTARRTHDLVTTSSYTRGADFQLATSTFRGSQQLGLGGFFVNTSNPRRLGKSNAFGLALDYPNDPWSGSVFYREIQENYDAEVGFTPRKGFRWISPALSYTNRPKDHQLIRTFSYGLVADLISDTNTLGLLNRNLDLIPVNIGMHSGDSIAVHVLPTYEKLESDFKLSQTTLPSGSFYTYTRYQLSVSMAQRRKISFSPIVEVGTFYNGTRTKIAPNLNVRLRPGVIIYTAAEWNRVHLPTETFETRLFRVVPELQFSPWVAWVNNIQYDTQSAVVGWQSRFRWILKPGDDFYLVYTHNWLDDPLQRHVYTLDRRIASKLLYTHRF